MSEETSAAATAEVEVEQEPMQVVDSADALAQGEEETEQGVAEEAAAKEGAEDGEIDGEMEGAPVEEGEEEAEELYEEHSLRHHEYVPSDHLMMQTNNRRNDLNELLKKREQKNVPPPHIKKNFAPPSDHLTKTTQARISEIKQREERKEELLQRNDIWWEARKPPQRAKPLNNVASKLYEPTKAYLVQQRSKAPINPLPDKGAMIIPGSPQDPASPPAKGTTTAATAAGAGGRVAATARIDAQSPLLRPTRSTQQQQYNAKPPPPPQPHLELCGMQSGPQNVQSKLLAETDAMKYKKYKSKEDLESELRADRAAANRSPVKVKTPSPRLLQFNAAMRRQSRSKAEKPAADKREGGWDEYFINNAVISRDQESFAQTLPPVVHSRDSWQGNVDIDESQYDGVHNHHNGLQQQQQELEQIDGELSNGHALENGATTAAAVDDGDDVATGDDAEVAIEAAVAADA